MENKSSKFGFIAPCVILFFYLIMLFINYIYNKKDVLSEVKEAGLIKAGAMNGDSPFYRVFTGAFLQSSLWMFVVAFLLLVITWIYIDRIYGTGFYVVAFIVGTIVAGLLSIHLTPDHVTAGGIAIMVYLIGIIGAAYIKVREQDVMIILIICGILVIASLFIPGGQAVNIIVSIIMLALGIGSGLLMMLALKGIANAEYSAKVKKQLKAQEKERKEQEKIEKQREKIRQKHMKK